MLTQAPRAELPKSRKAVRREIKKHLKTRIIDHFAVQHPGAEPGPAAPVALAAMKPANPPPAPSSAERPVMTAVDLIYGDYLEPGDVVLMTRLGSFFSWLLRVFDHSDFAHAAMVFQTPRPAEGIDQTFLIETSMGGVEIVSLAQFLAPKNVYADTGLPPDFVIGIRRLETEWAGVPHRRMASSRMIEHIQNKEYNFRLLAALASPRTRSLYFRLRDTLRGKAPSIGDFFKTSGSYMPKQFICSGFVQYAFYDMVRLASLRGYIPMEIKERALEDILFSPDTKLTSELEELVACTPKLLANTEKLQWKYLVHQGEVFHVSTQEQVTKFFKETLPERRKREPRLDA